MAVCTEAYTYVTPLWALAGKQTMCYTLSEVHTVELESDKTSCLMNLPRTMSRSASCTSSRSLTSGASTLLCLDQLVNLGVVETRFVLIQRGMGFLSYSLKYNLLPSLKIRSGKYFEV